MEWRNIPADDPVRQLERMRAFIAATIEPAMHAVHPDYRLHLRGERKDAWFVAVAGSSR